MLGHSSLFVKKIIESRWGTSWRTKELKLLVNSQQAVGKGLQNAHVKLGAKVKNVRMLKMKYCVTPIVLLA